MKTAPLLLATLMTATAAFSQVMIPEGTQIRLRLVEILAAETAEQGKRWTSGHPRCADRRRRRGRQRLPGHRQHRQTGQFGRGILDFSIDRVQLVDGSWINLRYTPRRNSGNAAERKVGVRAAGSR